LTAIGSTAYDLVIIDYSADGSESGAFSRREISGLKNSVGGSKIVLAYMSIGEVEDYRFYWRADWDDSSPSWLSEENLNWAGNYKVRYWVPEWRSIIFRYVDSLLEAGFDGAYLDIIDAYEFFDDQGRDTAAQDMADFVAAIADHARASDPGFLIFPQNAPQLAALAPEYLDIVNGIGQEEIYFGYQADGDATPADVTAEMERYLDLFTDAGKLVLTVDYTSDVENVDLAYSRAWAKGYVPLATVRDLDRLTVNEGHRLD